MNNNFKMNGTHFDTFVKRDARRNGFDNCDVLDTYRFRISSTAHSGVAEVSWDEENGFRIWFSLNNEEIAVGDVKNLAGAIRNILDKSLAHDERVA